MRIKLLFIEKISFTLILKVLLKKGNLVNYTKIICYIVPVNLYNAEIGFSSVYPHSPNLQFTICSLIVPTCMALCHPLREIPVTAHVLLGSFIPGLNFSAQNDVKVGLQWEEFLGKCSSKLLRLFGLHWTSKGGKMV